MTFTSSTDKKTDGGAMAAVSGFFKKSFGKFFTQENPLQENPNPEPTGIPITTYTYDHIRVPLTGFTKEDWLTLLKEYQLDSYWPQLERLIRPEIKIQLKPVIDETLPLGSSRVGGIPDLPAELPWVTDKKGAPLSFLAQINCRELKAFDSEKLLPDSGLLYFFYDPEQSATGVDPKDREKFKVLYYDGPFKNLKPVFFPEELPDYGQFDECSIHFMSSLSLPDVPGNWGIHMTPQDLSKYQQMQQQNKTCLYHKMLGYANPLRNSMELDCQLVTNGIYIGNSSGFRGRRRTELEKTMGEWRVLLQLHSDDYPGMIWGEEGRLYFWIKTNDLKNRNFKNSWVLLQTPETEGQ